MSLFNLVVCNSFHLWKQTLTIDKIRSFMPHYVWFKSNTHLIAETLIQCVNAKEGCDWKGTLAELDTHKHVCLYRSVQCPKCFKLIKKYELEKHLSKDCTGRIIPCTNTEAGGKWTGKFTDLATYRETCDRNSVQCPHQCGELIKVQSLHHHTSEGSERHTACPNKGKGCLWVGQASDIENHIKKCIYQRCECTNLCGK